MYSKARAKFSRRVCDSVAPSFKGQDCSSSNIPGMPKRLFVRPKIRLDPVVKLEEQREELRLREMAEAGRRLKTAEELLADKRTRAGADERRLASACDWQLAELSHTRALSDVRAAEQVVRAASEDSNVTRDRYSAAHSRAEALRKVAEVRVGEIIQARDTAERREQDEMAILRHGRRQAA
jgi:flagellar biosynthesis chaperone FliJ